MPINATFHGFIETTTDSLLLFEACRRGVLPKISRRLQERERGSVKSGTVFVFDEKESGIKRWTDGLIWSPSRILGNFLIYRELGGRESLNDKHDNHQYHNNQYYNSNNQYHSHQQYIPQHPHMLYEENIQESIDEDEEDMTIEERNRECNLVGSLTDTYKFRKGGLIKKTLSIQLNGCTQHLISYYTKEDVLKCRLATPSSISEISCLQISPELLLKQSFRVPPSVEFAELMLKRPSLSPSSTTSSSTSSSTTVTHHHQLKKLPANNMSHPYSPLLYQNQHQHQDEDDDHSLYHSRRLVFETPSGSRKSARTSIDSTSGSSRRSSSYLSHPLDSITPPAYGASTDTSNEIYSTRYNEGREVNNSHNGFRTSSSVIDNNSASSAVYETNSYQNINNTPQPSLSSHSAFISSVSYDRDINQQQQRRHSNNSSVSRYSPTTNGLTLSSSSPLPPLPPRNYRQNSHAFPSSSPPALNYQQRLHDIPTISILPSPSYQQQQQQGQNHLSPPLLSPSRFLWSNTNEEAKFSPPSSQQHHNSNYVSNNNNNKSNNSDCISMTASPTPTSTPSRTTSSPSSNYNTNNTGYNKQQDMAIALTETTPMGSNHHSRYYDNNNKLPITSSFGNHGTQEQQQNLYIQQQQQQQSNDNNNHCYHSNNIYNHNHNNMNSPNKTTTNNKNTSFY